MYKGKRIKKFTHMSKRAALLVLSLVMILSVSVGGTLAYLIDRTNDVTNVFQPGEVFTETEENFNKVEKKDVQISTEGSNVDTYVRAKIVITWVDKEGNVLSQEPVQGVDYTITFNEGGSWIYYGSDKEKLDDFWYCSDVVKAGEKTPVLIQYCSPIVGRGPVNAQLQVTILSQAIQASDAAINDAWKTPGIKPITAN